MKLLILLISTWSFAQNTTIKSFGEAKGKLQKIYGNKNTTFYCGCKYQKKSIKSGCGIKTKKFKKRQKRVEWEHVVPAHAFGQSFQEWRESKRICPGRKNKKGKIKKVSNRKCAAKKNKLFKSMESDIYNLVPAVGAINALRSNFSMAELNVKKKEFCKTTFHIANNKVMPPKSIKGDIARIYQYMDIVYPGRGIISNKNKKLFQAWSKLDPVDKQECNLYLKKKKIQKNINPILEKVCQKNL